MIGERSPMVKTLVLGIGNTIRGDDGIGIYVARALRKILPHDYQVKELSTGGLELMEAMSGYQKVFLIDAIRTLGATPGHVHHLSLQDFAYHHSLSSSHGLSLRQILEWGKKIVDKQMPEEVEIIAIEAPCVGEFAEGLSPRLQEQFAMIVERVKEEIRG